MNEEDNCYNCGKEGIYFEFIQKKRKRIFTKISCEECYKKTSVTKGSITAKGGNNAETLFCIDLNIKEKLEKFFDKTINTMYKLHGKKSDIVIFFTDGSSVNIQLKNSTGGKVNRGHSFDRRYISDFPASSDFKDLFRAICLKNGKDAIPTGTKAEFGTMIDVCLGGNEHTPDYFIHTETNGCVFTSLSVIFRNDFFSFLKNSCYDTVDIYKCSGKKLRTTIVISPHLYFQRKGSTKTDVHANHIQGKLKFSSAILKLFTTL